MELLLLVLNSTSIVLLLASSSLVCLSTLYLSVLFVFYILFIFSILILINMAENGVHEIADQLETLTAQSPAPQDASHVPTSQVEATEYASQDSFLHAPE